MYASGQQRYLSPQKDTLYRRRYTDFVVTLQKYMISRRMLTSLFRRASNDEERRRLT
jgi:hypothetical protein